MTVLAPAGFVASGIASGIKPDGELDLALVATGDGGPVAVGATFTSNLLPAAPVQVCRSHIATGGGLAGAVVINSGCANAATGPEGRRAAELTCELTARALRSAPAARPRVLDRDNRHSAADRADRGRAAGAHRCSRRGHPSAARRRRGRFSRPTRGRRRSWSSGKVSSSVVWRKERPCWRRTWRRCWPCSRRTRS